MEILEKKEQLNELFDLYKELLTEKQTIYYTLYYHEDYSFQEVADVMKVSRNAVFDHLKKVEDHLNYYEEKLKLLAYKKKRIKLLDEYIKTKDFVWLETLRKMDE